MSDFQREQDGFIMLGCVLNCVGEELVNDQSERNKSVDIEVCIRCLEIGLYLLRIDVTE